MKLTLLKSSKAQILLVFIVAIFGALALAPGSAKAAYDNIPRFLPDADSEYINLTDGDRDVDNGGPGAYLPAGYLKIYARDNGARTIFMDPVHRAAGDEAACANYSIEWRVWQLDGNGNGPTGFYPSSGYNSFFVGLGCDWVYPLNIPAGLLTQLNASQGGVYSALIEFRIVSVPSSGSHTGTFKVYSDENAKLGFSGGNADATIYPSQTAYDYRPGHTATITMNFRPPCNYTSGSLPNAQGQYDLLTWKDDDWNPSSPNWNQLLAPTLAIFEYKADDPIGAPPVGFAENYGLTWGNGGVGHIYVKFKAGYRYSVNFLGIQGGNGIQLRYPFDSGDFYFGCTPPAPSLTCTGIDVDEPAGFPANSIAADDGNSTFTVKMTLQNNNPTYPAPASYGGGSLSGSVSSNGYYTNLWYVDPLNSFSVNDVSAQIGPGIPAGGSKTVSITLPKPTDITKHKLGMYADYVNVPGLQFSCPDVTIKVYKSFTITPHSTLSLSPSDEDPSQVLYRTWINNNASFTVDVNQTSCLYRNPQSNCGAGQLAGPPGGTVTYNSGDTYTQGTAATAASYDIPPPVKAGDTYYARINLAYSKGYRGPDGPGDLILTSDALNAEDHEYVKNKPFFKVYNGSISAGGSFRSVSSSCTNPLGEGILGGYNNTNFAGYNFGSSADLTTWALAKITGVASSRVKYDRSPYATSLANTVNIGINKSYDSDLGGDYGPNRGVGNSGDVRCLTAVDYDHDKPFPAIGSSINITSAWADGQYHSTASVLKINASTIVHNVSIFADHDVYITQDVQYSTAGWTIGHLPSLVVHAKGNIYIKNSVGYLDGMYLAEKANGKISTCSTDNGVTPRLISNTDVNYFSDCNKQLVVRGSFVADRINLMRTFGTMRDEKPSGGSGGAVELDWLKSNTGNNYLMQANNRSAPGYTYRATNGYILPTQSEPGSVPFYQVRTVSGQAFYTTSYSEAQGAITSYGFSYPITIIGYIQSAPTADTQPLYRWNNGFHYYTIDPTYSGGTREGIAGYVYRTAGLGGTSMTLPTSLTCSNNGGLTFNYRRVAGSSITTPIGTPYTCAAEVFDFSPEQYMLNPSLAPPNGGAPVWDSVTSLPPVL